MYMQARYYDPIIGRFYSNDPVDALTFLNQGNVHGFNRYAYANNNPYRFIDPDGKAAQESFKKWSTSWTSIKNSAVNAISGVGELAQQTGDSVGEAISSSTSPENLRTASNDMATIAVGATLVGQVEVAAPVALISTALGYAAAVQGDNPVQEVVVEAVVNFSAKPIGIVSKGAATKLEGNVRNGVESAGQFLENEYKDLIKSEK